MKNSHFNRTLQYALCSMIFHFVSSLSKGTKLWFAFFKVHNVFDCRWRVGAVFRRGSSESANEDIFVQGSERVGWNLWRYGRLRHTSCRHSTSPLPSAQRGQKFFCQRPSVLQVLSGKSKLYFHSISDTCEIYLQSFLLPKAVLARMTYGLHKWIWFLFGL